MAGSFNYNTPDDFSKDEEKWLKIFTWKSLLATLVFCLISGIIFIPLLRMFNCTFIGIVIMLVFGAIGFAGVTFEIPVTSKLPGAGNVPFVVLYRIILRKLPWNKVIYVKGYGEYEHFYDDEDEEGEVQ